MSQLQTYLQNLLAALTDAPVSSLAEMKNGCYLSAILHAIDPDFFPLDPSLDDWAQAKCFIDGYLVSQGIQNKSLEFNIQEIEAGSLEQLCEAVFQLLALAALFNPQKWKAALAAIDQDVAQFLQQILDPMVDEVKRKFDATHQPLSPKGVGDVAIMLQKMEVYEDRIVQFQQQVSDLKRELHMERDVNASKQQEIDRQRMEIAHARLMKEDLLHQIELLGHRESRRGGDLRSEKVAFLQTQLQDAQKYITELLKDNDRLKTDAEAMEQELTRLREKARHHEELSTQYTYYKTLCETLRTQAELTEARLKGYEAMEKQLKDVRNSFLTEKHATDKLKMVNSGLQNKVESLLKRLHMAEEKSNLMRNQSVSHLERCNEMAKQLSLIRQMEEKNLKMRNALASLMKIGNITDLKKLQKYVVNEGLVQHTPGHFGLASQVDLPASGLYDQRVCFSMAELNMQQHRGLSGQDRPLCETSENIEKNHTISDEFKELKISSSMLDNSDIHQSLQVQETQRYQISPEQADILYSVLFEGQMSEYLSHRNLVADRSVRERAVLEPFPIYQWVNQLTL
jgi:hypothetical protein